MLPKSAPLLAPDAEPGLLAAGDAALLAALVESPPWVWEPHAASVNAATVATETRAARIERRCTCHLRGIPCHRTRSGRVDDADTRGTYPTDGPLRVIGVRS